MMREERSLGEQGASALLTGGAGFFGEQLARRLVADGWDVRILDQSREPAWAAALGICYRRGDVSDEAEVRLAMEGVDAVIHAAFAPPGASIQTLRRVNVDGTRSVLAAARSGGGPRVVVVSSTIVDRPLRPHPLSSRAPLSRLYAYQESRRQAEEEARRAAIAGLSVAVARPKTFIGPGGVTAFAGLFELVRQGRPVPFLGRGENRYQLVDLRDLTAGLSLLLGSPATGVFSFGAASFDTVAEDLSRLLAHAGTGARLRRFPSRASRGGLKALELVGLSPLSEWHHWCARGQDGVADISRASDELGWQPTHSNAASLIAAYDWYASSVSVDGSHVARPMPVAHRRLGRVASVVFSLERRPGPRSWSHSGE